MESQLFKDILAQWASGVTVLTTVHEGQWKGTTASSFTSVSMEPPLVLVCLATKLYTHQLVDESGIFAANLLAQDQVDQGKLFAGMMPEIEDRFAEGNWQTSETGCPVMVDALGWVDCKVVHRYPAGDHTIFVGEVVSGGVNDNPQIPMVYHNRTWGRFSE